MSRTRLWSLRGVSRRKPSSAFVTRLSVATEAQLSGRSSGRLLRIARPLLQLARIRLA